MPSTDETNTLDEKIIIEYDHKELKIDVYDTPLGARFLDAFKDNLRKRRILEKNFCFLGWASSKRDLKYLTNELNTNIDQINSFLFDPPYEQIKKFQTTDFHYSEDLPIGREDHMIGLKLKHEACNLLHRHFEELQGTAWEISKFYLQADHETKYAIRQLNNLCHEIESWVLSYRKTKYEPEWIRPSQITTFLNAPRRELHDEDFKLFKLNRYNRELGGVYLHWSQVGKTLYEVFRDEDAPVMTEALCSEINHQKYYSGEFDIEWGQSITEADNFKEYEIKEFKDWLAKNNFDWNDDKLSLGYIKLGQIDLNDAFGDKKFLEIYEEMKNNLNIKKMYTTKELVSCDYPYSLENDGWKQIQIEGLTKGYESRSMR